eukprot:GEMP01042323.1.p1 GENE.GEMP01042323.1~~GEMP01042323.1.p1  ORF type:complete len:449 (+),score=108.72 GEMP01042323.1:170-1516(+)
MSLSISTLCDLPSHEQRRRLLGIQTKKTAECGELLAQNALHAICKLMQSKKDEAETLRLCALALYHFATTLGVSDLAAMQDSVAHLGLLDVLVESMKWNAGRVELQCACMLSVGSIIGGSDGMVCQDLQLLAHSAMNQCLTNLRKFKDSPKVVRAAAVALTVMVYNNPENQDIFIKGHGIEIVVQAMQLSEDREVLKEACALLNNMCFESPVNQDRIAQRGCVPRIIKLLIDYSEDDGAAEEACCLIANLAQLNQKLQRFMISNNAASAIAKVLRRPNVELVRWALAALGRLCEGSVTEAQDTILETHAIKYALEHVQRFPEETALQLQALAFFARLSENNVKVLKYLESTDVCTIVLRVIDTFIDSPTHAHFGAMTLAHLWQKTHTIWEVWHPRWEQPMRVKAPEKLPAENKGPRRSRAGRAIARIRSSRRPPVSVSMSLRSTTRQI